MAVMCEEDDVVGAGTLPDVRHFTTASDFDGFYRSERQALYRALCLTLGDADLAAEAVDEGMVRAYEQWRRISSYDNPAGWVYRVALNWAISRRRRRRLLPRGETPVAPPEPTEPAIAIAINALPQNQRAVVILRFQLDWSIEQIATALRVPAGTVKSRLHRGLASLRVTLEGVRHES